MKYKLLFYPLLSAAFLLMTVSCASTPEAAATEEAVEETVEETTTEAAETTETVQETGTDQVVETVQDSSEVDASKLSAESARQKAVDAKAPKAVPALFEEGETLYASAKSAAEAGDLVKAAQDYLAAKDAYDDSAAEADKKKQEALAAMAAADEAIANVEKAAAEAMDEASEEGE